LQRDELDEVVEVGPEERLASRDVEALDAEIEGLAHELRCGVGRDAGRLAGPRADEAVRAGEVARVVQMEPQLARRVRSAVAAAPCVGLPVEGREGEESGPESGLEEVVDVEPGLARLQTFRGGVPRDEIAEAPASVERVH